MLEGCLWLEDMRHELDQLWSNLCQAAQNQDGMVGSFGSEMICVRLLALVVN